MHSSDLIWLNKPKVALSCRDHTRGPVETTIRKERQAEGIAKAKAKGVYKGRPKSIDREQIARVKGEGLGGSAIAKKLGIGRASVYRLLGSDTSPE